MLLADAIREVLGDDKAICRCVQLLEQQGLSTVAYWSLYEPLDITHHEALNEYQYRAWVSAWRGRLAALGYQHS